MITASGLTTTDLPTCAVVPIANNQLVNKLYVDTHSSSSSGTLAATLSAGNSAGSMSINMNSQPITNVSLISPSSTNKFSVVAIEYDQYWRGQNIPSPYNGQLCFMLDTKTLTYFSTAYNTWQTL